MDVLLPVVYTLLLWWFSTGAVLYVIGRHRSTFPGAMLAASALAILAGYALVTGAGDTTVSGAYAAFTAALVLWGWHEMSFLTGLITGPRVAPLPDGAEGSARLLPAIATVIYHELALFVTLAILYALLRGAPNEIGLWTFAILWAMRLSAKLNVFLGVSNLAEEFLPSHLDYLKSYFRRRPMNLLFPIVVTASSVVLTLVVMASLDPGASAFEVCGLTLLATLLALGILEHWFLVMPIPSESLWTWGLSSRQSTVGEIASEASSPRDTERAAPAPLPL
jgi:putative photosynthetic complex assembly protein 2